MENNFSDDIDYFYNNYKRATAKGKPNPRALKNLIIALQTNEIYLIAKQNGNTIR
jgi:hypothetical protein